MTNGGGQTVGGIQIGGHDGHSKHLFEEIGHLFLGGGSVSGDGLFDAKWGVFKDGHISVEGSGHGNPLCPAKFQHRLDIFAKEGRLQGGFIRFVFIDQVECPVENVAEFLVMPDKSRSFHHPQGDNVHLVVVDADNSVPHDICSGINAQDGLVDVQFFFDQI